MSFFNGKVVIVTGSSMGIGREIARVFAERGAKLTITGRNAEALSKTKEECVAAGASKENVLEVLGEITDEAALKKIVSETVQRFGQIDVLINNAGAAVPDATPFLEETSSDNFDKTMTINTKSTIRLSQIAAPHLIKTKGAIVNISSVCGLPLAMDFAQNYGIAKAALDQATIMLATSFARKGVRVNGVNPGVIRSEFQKRMGMDGEGLNQMYSVWDKVLIGRIGEPGDIAKAVLFLADRSQSEFIVGQRLVVDGGATLENKFMSH